LFPLVANLLIFISIIAVILLKFISIGCLTRYLQHLFRITRKYKITSKIKKCMFSWSCSFPLGMCLELQTMMELVVYQHL